MSALLLLSGTTVDEPAVAPVYPALRTRQRGPDRQLWVERSDGTRLQQVHHPVDPSVVRMALRGGGGFEAAASLGDPGAVPLVVDGDRVANWETEDIELAWYRDGRGVERGPVVDGDLTDDTVTAEVHSDEAYVEAQVIGSEERQNWMPQGDPMWPLAGWATSAGVTATEEDDDTWDGQPAARLQTATPSTGRRIRTQFELPRGTTRNYAYIVVRFKLERGARLPGVDGDQLGQAVHATADDGAFAVSGTAWPILTPYGYTPGTWGTAVLPVPQLADLRNRFTVDHFAGSGDGVIFGETTAIRDENVSALDGQDVGILVAGLYQHLCGLMGPRWGRRNAEVGEALHGDVRYLAAAHRSASSILAEWAAYGDWWVEQAGARKVMCFGKRGRLVDDIVVSSDNHADWRIRTLAAGAANVGFYTSPDLDGPAVEEVGVRSATAGPHRLAKVATTAYGMPPAEVRRYGVKDLAGSGAQFEVDGVPQWGLDGSDLPGDILNVLSLGDRVRLRFLSQRRPGWVQVATRPRVVRCVALEWDPVTDRVRPSWEVVA